MKQPFITRWLLAAVLVIAGALTCQAQLRMGVKGGAVVNDLRFNRDVLDADNRMGFVGGIMADLSLPITGFGVEASVLYTHRDNRLSDGYETFKRDYVDIPVHLRFKLGVVGLGRIISPYVFTGPNFSILFHEDLPTGYESSKTYMSWDFGAGVELFQHLRVAANYGIGFNKAMRSVGLDYEKTEVQGKDRFWTITAAYLF